MSDVQAIALDRNGHLMRLHDVFTICEAGDIVAVRQACYEFMVSGKRANSGITSPDQVMTTGLRPIGSNGGITHYACHRKAYCDEWNEGIESLGMQSIPSLQVLELDFDAGLAAFGLEVV